MPFLCSLWIMTHYVADNKLGFTETLLDFWKNNGWFRLRVDVIPAYIIYTVSYRTWSEQWNKVINVCRPTASVQLFDTQTNSMDWLWLFFVFWFTWQSRAPNSDSCTPEIWLCPTSNGSNRREHTNRQTNRWMLPSALSPCFAIASRSIKMMTVFNFLCHQ